MKIFYSILCLLLLFLNACTTAEPEEIPGPTNAVSGVTASSQGSTIILRRNNDILKIGSKSPGDEFKFFSAIAAPVIIAEAHDPIANETNLIRLNLPMPKHLLRRTTLQVLNRKPVMQGKQITIEKLLSINPSGTLLTVEYTDEQQSRGQAVYNVLTKTVRPAGSVKK